MYKKRLKIIIDKLHEQECEQLINIINEYLSAIKKHPNWPDDIIHAGAIVNEESGELIRACLQFNYENGEGIELLKESIQVGAMSIRFLVNTQKKLT
jgi:NTP pyrophosphatase (non-canonical NTP hydrolase)